MTSVSTEEFIGILKRAGLRDTAQRRLVIDACLALHKPVSPQDVQTWLHRKHHKIDLVTVYRILEKFSRLGLTHQHACNGRIALCTMPEKEGHHGFLHCESCGRTSEFLSSALCRVEDAIARKLHFSPTHHVTEIIGTCRSCSR